MALVSLPPVTGTDSPMQDLEEEQEEVGEIGELINIPSPAKKTKKRLLRQGSVSENFFAVQGASLILPRQSTLGTKYMEVMQGKKFGGDLKTHLYAICNIIRQQDSIKLVARLESWVKTRPRYLVIITTIGRQDTEESIILGMDFQPNDNSQCTIGLVIPIWSDTAIRLDGDGGFHVTGRDRTHTFKPVSVQAMWSALQSVHKCIDNARLHNYYYGSLYLTWTCYYESRVSSSRLFLNEWEYTDDLWSRRPYYFTEKENSARESTQEKIRGKLKEVMMLMDLDNCNSRDIREALEKVIDLDLKEYKTYIDTEMLTILGQMDTASKILDFLYLGSEWNASNLEELNNIGVTHVLNITMEIDNFFPDDFIYKNIRCHDIETTDLLHVWNDTWKFIKQAYRANGKCLVHCKMGISRSAASVSAFLMKENLWSMEKALSYVKDHRSIIHPNKGFMRQLQEYEGILNASAQRHNLLFRSLSESNLLGEHGNPNNEEQNEPANSTSSVTEQQPTFDLNRRLLDLTVLPYRALHKRPKSWSPGQARHYYLDEILSSDQCGEYSRSHMSEPKDVFAPLAPDDRAMPINDKRKKWRRRNTERVFPMRNDEFDSITQSEDSVFANPGVVPVPRIDTWMIDTKSLPDTKKKTGRMSSPAAMETCKSSLDVDTPVHSSFVSPMNSPSFQCTKNINISDLKSHFRGDDILQVDISGSTPVVLQTDQSLSSVATILQGSSPLSENISESNVPDPENLESESQDVVGQMMPRERSFSENQLFVKNMVSEIESRYTVDANEKERGKENADCMNTVGISRSQSLTTSKSSSMAMILGDPPATIIDERNQNLNNNNNATMQSFPTTTVIEIDHDANNAPQIVKTTSQPGCSIKEKVSTTDLTLALSSPTMIKSDADFKRNIFVRTLTQSELQVIREVGKTFLSESEDSESLLLSESSSLSSTCTSTTTETEPPLFKKRGVVRRMAKMIENNFKKQTPIERSDLHNRTKIFDIKSSQPTPDSTTVINKLLMGGGASSSSLNKSPPATLIDNNFVAPYAEPMSASTHPVTLPSSNLNDLLSLVGPTPYSPIHKSLGSVTWDALEKSSKTKGGIAIRRTQSERSFVRPIKKLFHSFREKQPTDIQSDFIAESSKIVQSTPDRNTPPVAVKQIVESIENLGIADDVSRNRREFARKKRLFSGDSSKSFYQRQRGKTPPLTRSSSNPYISPRGEGQQQRNIKSVFSRGPIASFRARNKYTQVQFQRHNNLYQTM